MKIHLATDHAGFELKEALKPYLVSLGHDVEDHGAVAYDADDDYPAYILAAARAVARDESARAIVLGKSGQGEAMVANRVPGVRAAVFYGGSMDVVRLSREHNDANVLSLGAQFVAKEEAEKAVRLWLATSFSGELRHIRRKETIEELTRS